MPELDVEDAYRIQAVNLEQRLERGLFGKPTRQVGHKIGITDDVNDTQDVCERCDD